MKHNHSCTCEHSRVEFCKVCKVVHCLDCNQEWRSSTFTYTNPWYYGTYLGQTGIYNGGGVTNTGPQNLNTRNDGHETLCNHSS